MNQLLNKKQAAQLLQISERTVDLWRMNGRLKFVQFGPGSIRFRPQDIQELVDCSVVNSDGPVVDPSCPSMQS